MVHFKSPIFQSYITSLWKIRVCGASSRYSDQSTRYNHPICVPSELLQWLLALPESLVPRGKNWRFKSLGWDFWECTGKRREESQWHCSVLGRGWWYTLKTRGLGPRKRVISLPCSTNVVLLQDESIINSLEIEILYFYSR